MAIAAVAAGAMRIGSMFARGAGKGGGMLRKAILKRTKVKRENIARNKQLNKKLMEKQRRREKASLLKAFKTRGKSGISGVEVPGKSFLDRVLEFFGVLLIGWLADKLPQIIAWVQDLIKRIKLLVQSLKSFISNLSEWFGSLGSLLTGTLDNLRNFDFTDQSGKVKKAMKGLENAFRGMQSDIDNAKLAVAGDYGSEITSESGELSGSESAVAKEMYDYLMTKPGMTENKAEGIVANIKMESGFRPDVMGDYGTSGGLFQMHKGRYAAMEAAVPNWRTNWKGQIDHALSTDRGPEYMRMNFASGGDAANWFMRNYERPSEALRDTREINQRQWLKKANLPGAGDGRQVRGANQTPAYQRAVNVGRALEEQGYRAWQHPDFNVHSGYTGSGKERVMRRSYNSYHNYGEALDYPLSHNSEAQLDKLASYFRQNKAALGIAEVLWRGVPGHDPDMSPNNAHLHVSFKGGGSVDRMPIAGNVDMGASVGQPQNTVIIIEEEAPPMASGGSKGGSSPIIMGASLNSIIKKHLLTSLAYN